MYCYGYTLTCKYMYLRTNVQCNVQCIVRLLETYSTSITCRLHFLYIAMYIHVHCMYEYTCTCTKYMYICTCIHYLRLQLMMNPCMHACNLKPKPSMPALADWLVRSPVTMHIIHVHVHVQLHVSI